MGVLALSAGPSCTRRRIRPLRLPLSGGTPLLRATRVAYHVRHILLALYDARGTSRRVDLGLRRTQRNAEGTTDDQGPTQGHTRTGAPEGQAACSEGHVCTCAGAISSNHDRCARRIRSATECTRPSTDQRCAGIPAPCVRSASSGPRVRASWSESGAYLPQWLIDFTGQQDGDVREHYVHTAAHFHELRGRPSARV